MPPKRRNVAVAAAREKALACLERESEAANYSHSESEGEESEHSVDVDIDNGGRVVQYPNGDVDDDNEEGKRRVMEAHFERLSKTMQNVALVAVRRLGDAEAKTVRLLKKQRPITDMDGCRMIARGFRYRGSDWTPADERALLAEWDRDPLRERLEMLDDLKQKELLPLWKTTIHFLSCFPTSIISPRNHLRYGGSFETEDGRVLEDPNWSKVFCRRFANVAVHGAFNLQPSLLALAMLYVAVCRTDYRGPIPWRNSTTEKFLDLLLDGMRVQDGSKSVVQVHREVLGRLEMEGITLISCVSTLFRRIEEMAFCEKGGPPFRPVEIPVFDVTVGDLATLTRAADSIKRAGAWVFLPVSLASRIAKAARRDRGAPKTLEQLNELREAVILNDRRLDVVHGRAPRQSPESEEEGPGSASEGEDTPWSGRGGHPSPPDRREDVAPSPMADDDPLFENQGGEPHEDPEPEPEPTPGPSFRDDDLERAERRLTVITRAPEHALRGTGQDPDRIASPPRGHPLEPDEDDDYWDGDDEYEVDEVDEVDDIDGVDNLDLDDLDDEMDEDL